MTKIHEGLVVHPGDTLVIRVDPDAARTPLQFNAFVDQARAAAAANGHKVIVVAAAQIGVIRAGEHLDADAA